MLGKLAIKKLLPKLASYLQSETLPDEYKTAVMLIEDEGEMKILVVALKHQQHEGSDQLAISRVISKIDADEAL